MIILSAIVEKKFTSDPFPLMIEWTMHRSDHEGANETEFDVWGAYLESILSVHSRRRVSNAIRKPLN